MDRLEDLLDSSKGDLLAASDRYLRWDVSTAPGALDRAASAHGQVIDGRLQRIHPEIFLLGDSFYIEGLCDVANVSGVIS